MMAAYLDRILDDPKVRQRVWQELTILDATEHIHFLMKAQKVTRSELAARLCKSKSHVSQLLDGKRNMTLRTLSDIFLVLGKAVVIKSQGADDPPDAILDLTESMRGSMQRGFGSSRTPWPQPKLRIAS